MATVDDRIAALEEKLRQQKAIKQKQEAQRRTIDQRRKRTEDTRRKVLIGAAMLLQIERGKWSEDKLQALMDQVLTRPDDRALFGLAEKPATLPQEPIA